MAEVCPTFLRGALPAPAQGYLDGPIICSEGFVVRGQSFRVFASLAEAGGAPTYFLNLYTVPKKGGS
jgi:hypothetical protein